MSSAVIVTLHQQVVVLMKQLREHGLIRAVVSSQHLMPDQYFKHFHRNYWGVPTKEGTKARTSKRHLLALEGHSVTGDVIESTFSVASNNSSDKNRLSICDIFAAKPWNRIPGNCISLQRSKWNASDKKIRLGHFFVSISCQNSTGMKKSLAFTNIVSRYDFNGKYRNVAFCPRLF